MTLGIGLMSLRLIVVGAHREELLLIVMARSLQSIGR